MCSTRWTARITIFGAIICLFNIPTSEGNDFCMFNRNRTCSLTTGSDTNLDQLTTTNYSDNWKFDFDKIEFMYSLRTPDDSNDLSVRGIVKWRVHLRNWTLNDTVLEGFLVTIMENDTNETVASYELTMVEPFEKFAEQYDFLDVRLEMYNKLGFDKSYGVEINVLPLGTQAPARSSLSIMKKAAEEKCSTVKSLVMRWAPSVTVEVFETTSEIGLTWKLAPSSFCIKTYEVTLETLGYLVLNTTEIEVTPGQSLGNASFKIAKDQKVRVKLRGKESSDGSCACVGCHCISDVSEFVEIESMKNRNEIDPSTKTLIHNDNNSYSPFQIFAILFGVSFLIVILVLGSLCCQKAIKKVWKQQIALNSIKTPQLSNRRNRAKKILRVLLVCPEIEGKENDLMMRIADALRKSKNTVICDRWKDQLAEVEENLLHWVYKQTQIADKIVIFHSSTYHVRNCGTYDMINNYLPSTDSRFQHIALSAEARTDGVLREVEYVMPRDLKLLEEAYDIRIVDPLSINIPADAQDGAASNVAVNSPNSSKAHSTDSGVSSLSCNSSNLQEGVPEPDNSAVELSLEQITIEKHPLLCQQIPV